MDGHFSPDIAIQAIAHIELLSFPFISAGAEFAPSSPHSFLLAV
jgi:hypothetical protein